MSVTFRPPVQTENQPPVRFSTEAPTPDAALSLDPVCRREIVRSINAQPPEAWRCAKVVARVQVGEHVFHGVACPESCARGESVHVNLDELRPRALNNLLEKLAAATTAYYRLRAAGF